MKSRFLIALVTVSMILQSFTVPVLAAEYGQTDFAVESLGGIAGSVSSEAPADPEALTGSVDSSNPDQPSDDETSTDVESPSDVEETIDPEVPSDVENPSDAEEPSDTENPSDAEEPSDTENPSDAEEPSDTEIPSDGEEPSDTEIPSDEEDLSDTEEVTDPEESADSDTAADTEKLPARKQPLSVDTEQELLTVSGGEGVYQEGSFTVHGESLQPTPFGRTDARLSESDRAEAEQYLYQQLAAKEESIDLTKYSIAKEEIGSFVHGVINEYPDLYFVTGAFSYYSNSAGNVTSILPKYTSGYDDDAFQAMLQDALSVVDNSMSELEKAIALHDYIVVNCEYDYENYLANKLPREVYSAYGVLVDRKAVCQGYALAYKLLLNRVGIECYMVTSSAMNHAWNLIKLDGQYYQVDTTWDDPVWDRLGMVGHNYMFLSDGVFQTESDVRKDHHDWVITKGSLTVDLTADSTRFDNEFWISCKSPIILDDGKCYYIDSSGDYRGYGSIKERDLSAGAESVLLNPIGRWTASNGGYWQGAYSGLFDMGDRLYYNTPTNICSIPIGGGEARTETAVLSSGDKYVYGVALRQGKIDYLLKTSPNDNKGDILPATLEQDVQVPVTKIVLDREEITMTVGETTQLSAKLYPTYGEQVEVSWTSDNEAVATVKAGLVTAVAEGNCTITASAGGKSAACKVQVSDEPVSPERPDKPVKPMFSEAGTVDKGSQVTISSASGTTIYYTTNGKDPVVSDKTTTSQYKGPITINEDVTIKAIAVSDQDKTAVSDVAEESFIACTNLLILETTEVTLAKGAEQVIAIKELPTTRVAKDVSWTSADTAIVTVSGDGKLKALLGGETVVTAEVEDHKGRKVTADCQVIVEEAVYQVVFKGFRDRVIKTEQVKAGQNATPPRYNSEKPEESDFSFPEGYRFTGWDGNYENITRDTEIRAKYEPIPYEITYELNGGKNAAGNPTTYTVESADIRLAPAGQKEGFLFTGWYEDEECQGNPVSVIRQGRHGNITLYAGWRDERGLWMKAEGSDEMNCIPSQPYTGKAIKPDIEVWYGDKPLNAGKDYTISYKNNTNVNLLSTEAEKQKSPTITIKGKGNFAGTLVCTFVITPKSLGIEEEDIQIDPMAASYNKGNLLKPVPSVTWNGRRLTNKKDFTVEYPDLATGGEEAYREPNVYSVRVQGCGNYTGSREIEFTITDPAQGEILLSRVKVSRIPDQLYTGKPVELTEDMPLLKMGSETLTMGVDYTLEYGICREIGSYQVLIVGQGKYRGVRRVSFKITGIPIRTVKVSKLKNLTYSGENLEYDPYAYAGAEDKVVITDASGTALQEGEDYELTYSNNRNVGNAKMTIVGKGAYFGTLTKSFKIVPYSLETGGREITASLVDGDEQAWQKGGVVPKVRVTFHGTELVEGTDYVLSGINHTENAVKRGLEPAVVIKGRKNFSGSRKLAFKIVPKDIARVNIAVQDMEENSRAGKYMSKPVLTDISGKQLKAGVDYEKTYVYKDEVGRILEKTDRPETGTVLSVTVTGKGNYRGSITESFRIVAKGSHLSKARVKVEGKFYYTGLPITPSKSDLTITLGKRTLTAADYDIIDYSNNVEKGTGKIIIRGKGNYGGTKQVSFRILSQNMMWWEK